MELREYKVGQCVDDTNVCINLYRDKSEASDVNIFANEVYDIVQELITEINHRSNKKRKKDLFNLQGISLKLKRIERVGNNIHAINIVKIN